MKELFERWGRGGGGIEMTTIDAFFRQCGLPCGGIKLDLEGMEAEAAEGKGNGEGKDAGESGRP